jgi:hypothetical protein
VVFPNLRREFQVGAKEGGAELGDKRTAHGRNAAGWGDLASPGEPVPALRVRHVDGAELSAYSIRALRGRCHLSLPKRQRGAGVRSALADRLAVCKLVLHPVKTKIVYCKDANRRGDFPIISFDFLGFQFRARRGPNGRCRLRPHKSFVGIRGALRVFDKIL